MFAPYTVSTSQVNWPWGNAEESGSLAGIARPTNVPTPTFSLISLNSFSVCGFSFISIVVIWTLPNVTKPLESVALTTSSYSRPVISFSKSNIPTRPTVICPDVESTVNTPPTLPPSIFQRMLFDCVYVISSCGRKYSSSYSDVKKPTPSGPLTCNRTPVLAPPCCTFMTKAVISMVCHPTWPVLKPKALALRHMVFWVGVKGAPVMSKRNDSLFHLSVDTGQMSIADPGLKTYTLICTPANVDLQLGRSGKWMTIRES